MPRVKYSQFVNIGWVQIEKRPPKGVIRAKLEAIHPAEAKLIAQPTEGAPVPIADPSGRMGARIELMMPSHCVLNPSAKTVTVNGATYVKLEDVVCWLWEEGDDAN